MPPAETAPQKQHGSSGGSRNFIGSRSGLRAVQQVGQIACVQPLAPGTFPLFLLEYALLPDRYLLLVKELRVAVAPRGPRNLAVRLALRGASRKRTGPPDAAA